MLPIFVGVPALIVLMLVVAWGTLEREFASGRMVREEINASFERRSQLQRVMSLLQDGETSQRGYVMESGEITLHGAAAQLLDDPKVRAAYLGE